MTNKSEKEIKLFDTYISSIDYKDVPETNLYQQITDLYQSQLLKQMTIPVTVAKQPTINYNAQTYAYNYKWDTYKTSPVVSKYDCKVEVTLDDGSVESITRDELVKYIGERKLVQENEVVRKMYDRFQVAAKLARSDDDGDTGV